MKFLTTDNLKAIYVKIKEKILALVYTKTEVDDLLKTINATLSEEDQAKLSKIITTGDGTKALFNDGTYKEITATGSGLTDEQLAKVNALLTNGDGSKYLSDDGTYKVIEIPDVELSEDDKAKLNTIVIDGDGTKALFNDGTFKDISQVTPEDRAKLDKLLTSGDGALVLYDNGEYKAIPSEVSEEDRAKINTIVIDEAAETTTFLTNHGTYVEFSLKKEDQDRLDMLVSNGKGNFFLSDNGSYIEMHATFTEEEYNKLKLVTDGVILPDSEQGITGPDEEMLFYNDGNWKAPYTSKEDAAKLNTVASGLTIPEDGAEDTSEDLFLTNKGSFKAPYRTMTDQEVDDMVQAILNPTSTVSTDPQADSAGEEDTSNIEA